MAYYTEAGTLIKLGLAAVDTDYFTSANITAIGTEADAWVDRKNNSASSAQKTTSSEHYICYKLLSQRPGGKLKGMTTSGASGSPTKLVETQTAQWHLKMALEALEDDDDSYVSVFSTEVPDIDGTW